MNRTILRSLQGILIAFVLMLAIVSLPDIASANQYLRYSTDNTYQVQPSLDLSLLKVRQTMVLSTDNSNSILIQDDTPSNIKQPKIHCNDSSPAMSYGRIPSGNPDYQFELQYNNSKIDCRNGASPFYRSYASSNQTMGITPMKLVLVKVSDSGSTAPLRYPNFQMCKREGSQSDSEAGCWRGERNGLNRYYPSSSSATVIVKPPLNDTNLTKAFSPVSINEGETSTLTLTITENTQNDSQDNKIGFTDTLRSGLVIATPANVQNSCTGGTITANDGGTTISVADTVLSNGTPSCSISVDVTAATAGSYINGAADMSSLVGIETSTMTDQTLTVIEPTKPPEPECPKLDLIENGSFETPVTTVGQYDSIPGWNLLDGPKIEIQHNVAGKPFEGAQLVELDSTGVSGIYQDIPTQPGQTYTLTFAFSARPNVAQNKLNVRWGDTLVAQLEKNGSGLSDTAWQVYSYELTATEASTRLSFDDLDELSDALGSYIDAISLTTTTCPEPPEKPEVCDPNEPIPGAFSSIRIGDIDGFGFGDGEGLIAANGESVNVGEKGVLTTGDFLPDFNGDGKFSNRDGGDPFDNRSAAEADGHFLGGDGYEDMGSNGSDYTDVFLGKAFTKLKSDYSFPDGDPKTLPNQPGFQFRFKVAKDKLPEGTPVFLNTMLGDYDVKPTQVVITKANGNSFTKELKVSEKGKTDGSIQASFIKLDFNEVFSDGDASGEPGYWVGSLDVDFDAPNEPSTSFDFAEIGTNKILLKPCS